MQFKSRSRLGSGRLAVGASLLLAIGSAGCALSDSEFEEGAAGEHEGVGTSVRELEADLEAGPFTITITPPAQNVDVDQDAFFNVQVDPLEGFSGDVSLDVTSDPPFVGFLHMGFGLVTPPGQDEVHAHGQCDTAVGTYDLTVTGTGDDGTTASATAVLTVDPTTFPPPSVFFFFDREGLTFQFQDSSFPDFCVQLVSWAWDFGDGSTSTERNPVHTYAVRGDYTVTLTVTDSQGLTGTRSQVVSALPPPPVLEIDRVTRIRDRFEFRVDLVWSGAEGDLVELHRNNIVVDLPDNDGVYRDRFRSLETSFSWFVCELGIQQCSNQVVLDVGHGPNAVEATVTTEIDGRKIVAKVPIHDE
jgi:hypothetical protein